VKLLRSVGGQLLAALIAVVLIALATTYLMVVPTLDKNLVSNRLNELERSANNVAAVVPRVNQLDLQLYAEDSASAVDARVVVFQTLGPPLELVVQADSLRTGTAAISKDRIVLEAAETGRVVSGTVSRGGVRRAEVAERVAGTSNVILLSGSLSGVKRTVSSVRRQLLVAVFPSLLLALTLGFLGARGLSQRVRRLERAADRIAAGEFENPVEDDGSDEIGELARSFESMRIRLARLEEARREFIANASHELRTPIFALSGSLELLADEEMDERSRGEFIETMRGQVERLQKLAIALLDLSRLDAGLELTVEPLELAPVAESLEQEYKATAELLEHPLSISVEASPVVQTDEQRTLQVGRILLENALLHTPRGTAVAICVTENGESGVLTVADEGPGIPAADQERVFERFFRLEGERSSGSGLGLAIAREWAMRMGGTVTLVSQPGATTFSLELPRAGDKV
jgi:two-component system, OmpR family, sensor kinase